MRWKNRNDSPSRGRGDGLERQVRVKRLVLALVGLGALGLLAVACTPQQVMEANVALGVNRLRAEQGLPPLRVDPQLAAVARLRAEDMARKNYFSHSPPDGCDFVCLYGRFSIATAWAGEVIAWNNYPLSQTVDVTVRMWKESPPHFATITNCHFERMGTGAAIAPDGKIYHVAVFEGNAPGCPQ